MGSLLFSRTNRYHYSKFSVFSKLLVFVIVIVLLYGINSMVHPNFTSLAGDDCFYYQIAHKLNYFDFLNWRYHNWSGRLFSESVEYFSVKSGTILFRLFNPLFLLLLAYAMVRCLTGKQSFRGMVLVLGMFCCISYSVLHEAIFWLTGSSFYLVPLSLGIMGMIPYADIVLRGKPPCRFVPFWICGAGLILAAFGSEQIALVCCVYIVVAHTSQKIRRYAMPFPFYIVSFVVLVAAAVNFLSPGSAQRFQVELGRFPGFEQFSFSAHLRVGLY
ncbi:MAG: DUF6056 family protein, partial [Ethanoligenens sp.]